MATITLGNSYRFKDYNNNKYLNILVNGNPANNSNVTIYSLDSSDMAQVWQCVQYSALGVSGALMKSVKDPTFALDNYRGSSNPNNADVYKIGTTAADLKDQLVEFILLTNGYYRIKLAYYDLYLTVTTESTYGGFNVRWQALTGNTNQLWAAELYSVSPSATPNPTPTAIRDKEFFVKAYGTNLNLNVYGTDTVANARNVNAYEKEDCLAQRWIAKQTSAGPKLFTKINQSYALNINIADNNCTMYTASGNDNDSVLEFEEAGDMLYRIKMFKYGKYLTVNGSTSGSNVVWSDYSSTATLWEFIPEDVMFPSVPKAPDAPEGIVGNTYAVQANGTDFYLNVHGTDTVADGRNVNIYSKDDCLAQRWFIKNTDNGPKLFTKVNEEVGYTLNIYTTDDNCTMYTDSTENDADSILEFVSVGNMLYRIKMYHHDKYLCIDGAATSGANVKWISGASSATVWKLIPEATAFPTPASAPATIVGKTFFIKNYNTGYNLNVHGTNTVALGRNVNVFAKEPEDSQRWQVVQTPKGPKIITEINPDFALNIHVENNNNCVMYDIDDNNADSVIEFVPYDEDKNIYKLKMFHHNKYLDAAGVGSGFNAYWSESPHGYTLWQFVEEDDMFPPVEDAPADIADKVFFIQNVNTGHYLNVNGADTVSNTRNVNVYAKEDCQAQRWVIRNKNGGPKLVTKIDETFGVNIYANDNNCTMYKEDGNDIDSVLQFIPYTTGQTSAEDGVYRIKMHYHNRYLTVSNTNIGANAWWTSVDTEPYALWRLIPEGEMTFEDAVDPDTTPDSPLVTKFRAAPSGNYLVGRDGCTISEITIHHVGAVGATIDSVYDSWVNSGKTTSSHYCVYGTQVGQYVKERNTAYTNGGDLLNPDDIHYNHRAVTIETCNSTGAPNWAVSDDTYYTLVRLVADIAKRNNLGTLVVGQNLTYHSMYASTQCPGPYLLSKMQDIADRANEINNRFYLRKQYTKKYLGLSTTNNLMWVDKSIAKAWMLNEVNGETSIRDYNNSSMILTIEEDGVTPVVSNVENTAFKVYGKNNGDNTLNIHIENEIATLDKIQLDTSGYYIAATKNGIKVTNNIDTLIKETEIDEPVEVPLSSNVIESLKNKPFRIKHAFETETYKNKYLTVVKNDDATISLSLEDKADISGQFWKLRCFRDNFYGLVSVEDEFSVLSLDPETNSYMFIHIGREETYEFGYGEEFDITDEQLSSLSVSIESIEDSSTYKITSSSHNKHLIAGMLENEIDINWSKFYFSEWTFEIPEYIVIDNWLRAYTTAQNSSNPRNVPMPTNEEVVDMCKNRKPDLDGYIYSFTNKNYWYSNQGFAHSKKTSYLTSDEVAKYLTPETMDSETLINEYGYLKLTRLMGKEPTVTIEDKGVLVDDSGRYWVAVGPAVIFEEYPPNGSPGDEMYGNGTLDVVILDINKVPYYVRCVVGGIKAHTWDNGKIQTWKAYEGNGFTKGELYSAGGNYYGVSCVEFRTEGSTIGDLNYSKKKKTLGKYEIDKIIFYDNPIQPAE